MVLKLVIRELRKIIVDANVKEEGYSASVLARTAVCCITAKQKETKPVREIGSGLKCKRCKQESLDFGWRFSPAASFVDFMFPESLL